MCHFGPNSNFLPTGMESRCFIQQVLQTYNLLCPPESLLLNSDLLDKNQTDSKIRDDFISSVFSQFLSNHRIRFSLSRCFVSRTNFPRFEPADVIQCREKCTRCETRTVRDECLTRAFFLVLMFTN